MAIGANHHPGSRRQATGAATQFWAALGIEPIAMPGADHGAGMGGVEAKGAKGMGAQAGKGNQAAVALTTAGKAQQAAAHLYGYRQAGFKGCERSKVNQGGVTAGIPI